MNLSSVTGKQRSHVIKVITIISNHLLVHAQGASIFLSKPSSLHLANLYGGNKNHLQDSGYAEYGGEAIVIMGKVGFSHTPLPPSNPFLCKSIIVCHLHFSPFFWQKKNVNIIKVVGMRDMNNSIRSPCNYLPHLSDTHKRTAGGLSWGLMGHKNLLPIKLST